MNFLSVYPRLLRWALQALLTLSLLSLISCQQLNSPGVGDNSGSATGQPFYQEVLTTLLTSDEVVPAMPPVHPVRTVYNREAIIPPQCYTRTEGKHNPCYVCHQDQLPERENTMNDRDLQEAYSFSDLGMTNHWQNLFEDRSQRVANISDEEIMQWVDQDNYSRLAERLRVSGYQGWIPDLAELQEGTAAFDHEGFAKDGSLWVAFNYKPFPGTFWPTNGSTDDVMIRLSKPYRTAPNGEYSRDIYKANLAIVEANIKGLSSIDSLPINEQRVGADLDGDGKLSITTHITKMDDYVGAAAGYFIEPSIYPKDTEFLHTVRYLGFDENGEITGSRRMKEVRYMKKWQTYPRFVLAQLYLEESYEKELGQLPGFANLHHYGLDNGMGWAIQGYIEGKSGELRANTYEENLFCMGCHGSIGSTIDKTFSFGRKIDGGKGWGYINLKGMPDAPNRGESVGEIATYLTRVGGGGEFRSNPEMVARWFKPDGTVDVEKMRSKDVYQLTVPSRERALMLNKAYRVIVDDQDFIFGRDATVTAPPNVYDKVDNEKSPTLPDVAQYNWDIRLDWQATGIVVGTKLNLNEAMAKK